MAKFFINRPIFAWVIAIVIMLAGTLSILNLPVSMYPQIAPPQVSISATYPGASAKTIDINTILVSTFPFQAYRGFCLLRRKGQVVWCCFADSNILVCVECRCRTVCPRRSLLCRK